MSQFESRVCQILILFAVGKSLVSCQRQVPPNPQKVEWTTVSASALKAEVEPAMTTQSSCQPSQEDIIRACEDGNDFFVTVLPRETNQVSLDENTNLFKFKVMPCGKPEFQIEPELCVQSELCVDYALWVESVSLNIETSEAETKAEHVAELFLSSEGESNLYGFEVLDSSFDPSDPEALLISGGYVQMLELNKGTLYLPPPAVDDAQVRIGIPFEGLTFVVKGWFDYPEDVNAGHYLINIDDVAAVDAQGHGLVGETLCNREQDLQKLTAK